MPEEGKLHLTTLQILHEKIHPGSDPERLLTSQKETELSMQAEGSRHLDLQRGLGMKFGVRMELPVSGNSRERAPYETAPVRGRGKIQG